MPRNPIIIEEITYQSSTDRPDSSIDNKMINRRMIVLGGVCFYESSGENSSTPNTWYPFLGLNAENNKQKPSKGDGFLLKPLDFDYTEFGDLKYSFFPKDVWEKLDSLFYMDQRTMLVKKDETVFRSYNDACLLISSVLGKGLWDTKKGRSLKAYLQERYPEFYEKCPEIEIKHIKTSEDTNEINSFLMERGANFAAPYSMSEFMQIIDSDKRLVEGYKSIEESAQKALQDCCKTLEHYSQAETLLALYVQMQPKREPKTKQAMSILFNKAALAKRKSPEFGPICKALSEALQELSMLKPPLVNKHSKLVPVFDKLTTEVEHIRASSKDRYTHELLYNMNKSFYAYAEELGIAEGLMKQKAQAFSNDHANDDQNRSTPAVMARPA